MSIIPMFLSAALSVNKPNGLVTDGLMFHLDGLNKGSDPTTWTELVSGEPFKLFNCDILPNAVNFRGIASSYAESVNNILQPFHDYGEFQVVFSPYHMTNSVWFAPPASHGRKQFSVGYYNGGIVWSNERRPWFRCPISNQRQYTLSVSENGVVLNTAQSSTTLGSDLWTANSVDKVTIGCRKMHGSPGDMYNGLIYAIRIYRTALTTEQILQNQTYDRERYFNNQGG